MEDPIQNILERGKVLAVVGLSSKPHRPSYGVARYMQLAGYHIIPVNPNEEKVLGEKGYARLEDVPVHPLQHRQASSWHRRPPGRPGLVSFQVTRGRFFTPIWMASGRTESPRVKGPLSRAIPRRTPSPVRRAASAVFVENPSKTVCTASTATSSSLAYRSATFLTVGSPLE